MSTTCTVSFTARGPGGAILPNARLIFVPVGLDVRGVGAWVVPRERIEATADSSGVGSVALIGGSWTVTMISTLGQMTAPFDCPASGVANLESLIGQNLAAAFNSIQLSVLAAGGRGLFETPAAGRAATVNGEVFLAPLSPNGVGIYRRDSTSVSPQIGTFFTGEVTTSQTDTTAGRLLKVGDFGLGAATAPVLADLDSGTIRPGFYRTDSATLGVFPPGANLFGHCLVEGYSSGALKQTFQSIGAAGNTAASNMPWVRRRSDGTGLWTEWSQHYGQGNIIRTVSQTGGVPTGGIIERGTNANGDYTRFADGTQTCAFTITTSTSADSSWTFPAAFSTVTNLSPAGVAYTSGTLVGIVGSGTAISTTAWSFTARDATNARVSVFARLTAIGRWF